ncbi:oligosaccharide flippase family protein [uncultured Alteromonas sp.]|uniref:oligosaccharide flippase family protein n=1 Tax=uncultured Alteromonas sp. TaxID=179113 RepID=UPI00258F9F9C|nr:oligosaccharide flippase family protein [uncultured Alteromonas sp.]
MSRIVNATSWTTLATIVNLSLTMVQLAILVRILAPEVFGQFAVVNMVIEVFVAFALGGISNFLIYKRDADQATSNAVYYLALGIGVAFSLLLFVFTPFIASALGYESIIQELRLATLLLVVSSLSSQYQAVGMKHFKHQHIAQIDIVAKLVSFGFAISFPELELLCLVGAVVIYQVLKLIGFMVFLGSYVNLSLAINSSIYREAFNYGIFDFGSQALNIIRKQLDVMILAITLPSSEMGIYHVIKQLASRPAQALQPIIGKVALPAFAEVKNDKDRFARVYKDFYFVQLFVLAFIYVPVIIASELVTTLFFGESYAQYSLVLSLLAGFWFIRVAASNLVGPLVQSTGLTKRNFMWNVYVMGPNALVIYVSSMYGVEALVMSMAVFQLFLFPVVNYYFIKFITGVGFSYSVKSMGILLVAFALPLILFYQFVLPFIPDVIFVKESAVGVVTLLIALVLFLKYSEVKQSLKRIKGF